ncbi:MAG: SgcJ/EcaC family oxidoreductase [Sphingomonas sp.]|nr:SgcJ/EcaC family oxidoreductase [Sphingomonas sp.]
MTDPQQVLRDYVHHWYEIFPRGDAAAMAALYTDDARLMLANLPRVQGKKAIGAMLGAFPGYAQMDCRHEVTDVDMLTDDLAVVTGSAWVDVTPRDGSAPSRDASRFVMVMKRDPEDGNWRCHYDVAQPAPDVS